MLIDIDNKHKTEFHSAFNRLQFRDFVDYVDEQTINDFLNFSLVKEQFNGFLEGRNNTLIDTPLIISFMSNDTIDKLTKVIDFASQHFISHYRLEHDAGQVSLGINVLIEKLKDYLKFYTENRENLVKYIRYQNYIRQGNDYIRFAEFEN